MASAPSPPTPPDPVATASAQAQANAGTATAQTALNNANVYSPLGSSTWQVTGSQEYTNPDGTKSSVPTYTNTQTLSPQEQQLFDQQTALGGQLNGIAGTALNNVNGVLSNPLQQSDLPSIQTSAGAQPQLSSMVPSLSGTYGSTPSLVGSVGSGPSLLSGYGNGGSIQQSVPYSNAATSFGQTADQVQGSLGDTNYTADRDAATNAALQRLAPTIAAQNEQLNSSLANQGAVQGSTGWMQSQLQQAQANNDLYLGAVQTGDQEQQALFNEAATAGQFHNTAQQQEYDQLQGRAQYGLNATTANNQAALNAGQFANAAQLQGNTENQQAATFANAAAQQQYQNQVTGATFANQAADEQMQHQLSAAGLAQQDYQNQSSAANQQFQNQISGATFANQAAQQSLAQQTALRELPLNEVSALMSGGQVTMPQFAGYNPGQVGSTPISQDTYASANMAQQEWAQQSQAAAQENAGLFGLGSSLMGGLFKFSDPWLKRDAIVVGELPSGLAVYRFRYVWSDADEIGVMADEVARVRPEAVACHPSGFLMVDYGRL